MYNIKPNYLMMNVPDIMGTIDRAAQSPTIWAKVKVLAVFVFLIGGLYVTLQSMWLKYRGVDENHHHRSIYKLDSKPNGRASRPVRENVNTTHKSEDGNKGIEDKIESSKEDVVNLDEVDEEIENISKLESKGRGDNNRNKNGSEIDKEIEDFLRGEEDFDFPDGMDVEIPSRK